MDNAFLSSCCPHFGVRFNVVASSAAKAAKAYELGADVVVDRSRVDGWGWEISKLTHKRGVDVIVDNVGVASLGTSKRAVARGGRAAIVGNTSGPISEMDIRYIFSKQINLVGSTMEA